MEGLLSSLCQTGPCTSRSLSASRANRRSAAYASSCAGKFGLKTGSPASATTLLAGADAWNKPYGANVRKCVESEKKAPHGVRQKEASSVKTSCVVEGGKAPHVVGRKETFATKTPCVAGRGEAPHGVRRKEATAMKTHSSVAGGGRGCPSRRWNKTRPNPTCACCVQAGCVTPSWGSSYHLSSRGETARGRGGRGAHPVRSANVCFANARPSVELCERDDSCRWDDAVTNNSSPSRSVGGAARFVGRYAVSDPRR